MKENTVDYIAFSYYMSRTEKREKTPEDVGQGNILGGIKNKFLKVSEWDGKLIRSDFKSL